MKRAMGWGALLLIAVACGDSEDTTGADGGSGGAGNTSGPGAGAAGAGGSLGASCVEDSCGGMVEGSWTIEHVCALAGSAGECAPGLFSSLSVEAIAIDGEMTFDPSGAFSWSWTAIETRVNTVPKPCLNGAACESLIDSDCSNGSCTDAGQDCVCTYECTVTTDPDDMMGTWMYSSEPDRDIQIAGPEVGVDVCIAGDIIWIRFGGSEAYVGRRTAE